METVTHHVGELSEVGRTAAETLVGHAMADNQLLVIQVAELADRRVEHRSGSEQDKLPDWCDVYAGLDDQQIAALDQAISRRLDLARART